VSEVLATHLLLLALVVLLLVVLAKLLLLVIVLVIEADDPLQELQVHLAATPTGPHPTPSEQAGQ